MVQGLFVPGCISNYSKNKCFLIPATLFLLSDCLWVILKSTLVVLVNRLLLDSGFYLTLFDGNQRSVTFVDLLQ